MVGVLLVHQEHLFVLLPEDCLALIQGQQFLVQVFRLCLDYPRRDVLGDWGLGL